MDSDQIPADLSTKGCQKNKQTDLYSVLGISSTATLDEIKSKYNELLLIHHPDKGGDPEKFRNLQIAYKILSNPKNREIYTKSLSSNFVDIIQDYRDATTGQYKDLGYEINENDFTHATTDEERQRKHAEFMTKFDDSRPDAEKILIANLKQSKSYNSDESVQDIFKRQRDLRNNLEEELDIPLIKGINPNNLNMDLFNQIFEATRQGQRRDIESVNQVESTGHMGLASYTDQGGIFGQDNWQSYQSQIDFQTYQQPQNVNIHHFNHDLNITRTKDNNPADLVDLMNKNLQDRRQDFKDCLYLDKEKYKIETEHDDRNNPLSEFNMLGNDFANLTLSSTTQK